MNKKSPVATLVWIAISCVVHILLFKNKVNMEYPAAQRISVAILAVVSVLLVHELVHFVFALIFCKDRPKIGFTKDPIGFPTLKTTFSAEVADWQEIMIYLAPFVVLTLILDIVLAFCPEIPLFFWIAAMGNCAGCSYDLCNAFQVLGKRRVKRDEQEPRE